MGRLEGKVAAVTAAAGAIGRGMALRASRNLSLLRGRPSSDGTRC